MAGKQRAWATADGSDYIVFELFYLLTEWYRTYFKLERSTIPALSFSNPVISNESSNVS